MTKARILLLTLMLAIVALISISGVWRLALYRTDYRQLKGTRSNYLINRWSGAAVAGEAYDMRTGVCLLKVLGDGEYVIYTLDGKVLQVLFDGRDVTSPPWPNGLTDLDPTEEKTPEWVYDDDLFVGKKE